ncbi:MAG: hypothetical protein K6D02_00765 [Lachnospiraceae bacterium]|nr:hypothetical protein [Lachnospiraceae bacterium]
MACFVVPAVEAVVTTTVNAVLKHKEAKKVSAESVDHVDSESTELSVEHTSHIPFTRKLSWLNKLLWGGSGLLAFEHLWHGEITPWAPFLTAATSKADTIEMFHEMSTVGVGMAVLITGVWSGMLVVSHLMEKKQEKEIQEES